jgi:hypothetical protein
MPSCAPIDNNDLDLGLSQFAYALLYAAKNWGPRPYGIARAGSYGELFRWLGGSLIGQACCGWVSVCVRVAGDDSWISVPPNPSADMAKLAAMCWPINAILPVCVPSLTVMVPPVLLLLAAYQASYCCRNQDPQGQAYRYRRGLPQRH